MPEEARQEGEVARAVAAARKLGGTQTLGL